ncbi:MAG TPA: hypothetical protein PL037_04315, partial [Elusimicrobiales bacterium]|nr:hypothetical protein [Elusimicrobiales bacterium]
MIRAMVLVMCISAASGVSAQEAGAPEGAAAPAVQTISADAEWAYLKKCGEDKDDEVAEAVLPDIETWLAAHPDAADAPEAQLLKARIHLRLGDYRAAIVDLLKHLQEYPEAVSGPSARKLFTETVGKKLDEKNAKILNEIA